MPGNNVHRPAEEAAFRSVMNEWHLDKVLDETSGPQTFYFLLKHLGWTTQEIATHRGVTPQGVGAHLTKLKKKMQANLLTGDLDDIPKKKGKGVRQL